MIEALFLCNGILLFNFGKISCTTDVVITPSRKEDCVVEVLLRWINKCLQLFVCLYTLKVIHKNFFICKFKFDTISQPAGRQEVASVVTEVLGKVKSGWNKLEDTGSTICCFRTVFSVFLTKRYITIMRWLRVNARSVSWWATWNFVIFTFGVWFCKRQISSFSRWMNFFAFSINMWLPFLPFASADPVMAKVYLVLNIMQYCKDMFTWRYQTCLTATLICQNWAIIMNADLNTLRILINTCGRTTPLAKQYFRLEVIGLNLTDIT